MTATLDDRTYRTADVVAITGASYRQVDYWARTGILTLDRARPGCGCARRWRPEQVRTAVVVANLVRLGCDGDLLRAAAAWCHEQLWWASEGDYLIVGPDRIDTAAGDRGLFLAGAGAWVVRIPPRTQ